MELRYTSCPDNLFSCGGKCYFHQMWCKERLQCVDGLDEAECDSFTCKVGLVRSHDFLSMGGTRYSAYKEHFFELLFNVLINWGEWYSPIVCQL